MKRRHKLVAAVLAMVSAFALLGCSEGGPQKTGAMATAIGLGHGSCVTEVTVILDGYGKPKKVQFDDIFSVKDVYNNMNLGADAPAVKVGEKDFYKYLRIGDKYFEVNANGIYVEIGATSGTGISDLMTYYKTEEGTQWYYNAFIAKALYVCSVADDGKEVAGVKLKDKYAFNTSNGSMRKRYSRYWSTLGDGKISQSSGLGFNGNMDMLENYLLAYGFDALDNLESAIVLPGKDGNNTNYNVIGGVTTGATLSADTGIYLKVAKAAYDKAVEMQKQI